MTLISRWNWNFRELLLQGFDVAWGRLRNYTENHLMYTFVFQSNVITSKPPVITSNHHDYDYVGNAFVNRDYCLLFRLWWCIWKNRTLIRSALIWIIWNTNTNTQLNLNKYELWHTARRILSYLAYGWQIKIILRKPVKHFKT